MNAPPHGLPMHGAVPHVHLLIDSKMHEIMLKHVGLGT